MKHKLIVTASCIIGAVLIVVIIDGLVIKYNGVTVPTPNTPRAAEHYGSGAPLTYVVMGDSTSVGQGGDYNQGFARSTARYLAQNHAVTFYNIGISGARSAGVVTKQLPEAVDLRPDVVLIAVGANDVTHLTSLSTVRTSLQQILRALRTANPTVKVVLTGSPQMGSVARFPQPFKYYEKIRTGQVNSVISQVASSNHAVFAPIAAETGAAFAHNPRLYARPQPSPSAIRHHRV
jgi:lysophospholipase L1-like esterase